MIQFRLFVDQKTNLDLFSLETTEPCQLTLKVGSSLVKSTKLQEVSQSKMAATVAEWFSPLVISAQRVQQRLSSPFELINLLDRTELK